MTTVGRSINHLWRVFATGFVFVLFGVGALFISLTMFPLLRLSTLDRDVARRRIQHAMQHTFRTYFEIMRLLGILTYEVHGVDRLKLAERLSAQRPSHAPPLNLCLQLNVGGEARSPLAGLGLL